LKPGRGRLRGILLLAALGTGAVLLLRVALYRPLGVVGELPRDGYVRVPAVLHVHTTLSDGGGTPDEAIRAARETGVAAAYTRISRWSPARRVTRWRSRYSNRGMAYLRVTPVSSLNSGTDSFSPLRRL